MKAAIAIFIFVIGIFTSVFFLAGCGSETYVTKVLKENVSYNVESFPEVKSYLVEAVESCGKGVIDPERKEENKCSFHIDVNNDLLERFKTGLMKNKDNDGKQFIMPTVADLAAVPEKWDMRDEFPAVKDVAINRQVCGDCWSQSTTKALEIMVAAYDKKIVPLSVQTQISTCRPDYGDCGGGYMTAADFLVKIGNPLESQDPYKGQNSSCKFSSDQLAKGFEYKLKNAPWVGTSLMHSAGNIEHRGGNTAEMIKALMYKFKSPALVTVSAYDVSGNGIVNSCSFGGTNHMVDIVGWGKEDGTEFASVWNSWGKGHGLNGISRIKWECGGPGKLNRRLGEEARVYEYKALCPNQPNAVTGPSQTIIKLNPSVGVMIGQKPQAGQSCSWAPAAGLADPNSCQTFASPEVTTEYHLTAKTDCGEATAMVTINVLGPKLEKSKVILTPFGTIKNEGEK